MTEPIKSEKIALPCLRGCIGDWTYYNVLIPFRELKRIDNNHLIKESKSLDKHLQRELSERKIKIKKYLLNENQRYFNSIIVGVYGDMPDWYSLDLREIASHHKLNISSNVQESLGIMSLSGEEILFTIDGQHRVAGIKLALEEEEKRFINDELSVVFVAHKDDEKGRIRTRRLFATINREAVKPSQNDLAIIDEVYAYNVIARDLFAKYDNFDEKIVLTPTTNLDRDNHLHFTNLLTLVTVNKKILKLVKSYKQSTYSGPNIDERDLLYVEGKRFWDYSIKNINEYKYYFSGVKTLDKFRNSDASKALNLLFVPIGQKFLAEIYTYFFRNKKLENLTKKINKLNFDLHEGHYKNLFYNPTKNTMVMNNQTVAKNMTLYLLGESIDETKLKQDLCKAYGINNLSTEFKSYKLPQKL